MSFTLTTGTRAPQIRINEKDRIKPSFADMFSCKFLCQKRKKEEQLVTPLGTSIKAFSTISGMQKKCFVSLNCRQLKPQSFNLLVAYAIDHRKVGSIETYLSG